MWNKLVITFYKSSYDLERIERQNISYDRRRATAGVAVWGEYLNLMKDCSLEKTNENMYYNSEWDYTLEESELEPEDKNDPDIHKVYEAGMHYIYSN